MHNDPYYIFQTMKCVCHLMVLPHNKNSHFKGEKYFTFIKFQRN